MRPEESSPAIARELPAACPRPCPPSEDVGTPLREPRESKCPQQKANSSGEAGPGDAREASGDSPGTSSTSSTTKAALLGSEVHKDKLEMLRRETLDVQEVLEQRKTRRSRRRSRRLAIESNVDRLFPLIATVLLDYKDYKE